MTTELGAKINIEDASQILNENIQELIKPEKFREAMKLMAHMRNYSSNNMLLIGSQRPDATIVMGYNEWKKVGRQVRKGEQAIKILAPLVKKTEVEKTDPKTGQAIIVDGKPVKEEKKGLVGYRAVNVFDVSQTDGKELALPRYIVAEALKEDQYMSKLYQDYKAFLNENRLPVTEEPARDKEKGYYHIDEHKIVISNDIEGDTDSRKFKTLIHEYAHSSLHGKGADFSGVSRSYAEVQAESVAFVVSHYYGLDTGDVSNGYIAQWGKNPELIREAITEIQEISNTIIDEINSLQKEKIQEHMNENSNEYEETKKYLKETIGLKEQVFEPEYTDQSSVQVINKEHGYIASATFQYSEKNEQWYLRTNRNMIEPLSSIGETGKFAILNVEKEIGIEKPYTEYARIESDYSVTEIQNGLFVIQFTPGVELQETETTKSSKNISKPFESKEEANEFKLRSGMAQALQEQMTKAKSSNANSRQRELEFTMNEIQKNVVSQVSDYVSHHSDDKVSFSVEGSTKVGWTILRNPEIKSKSDLERYAFEKSGLVSGKQISKALRESTYQEINNEKKQELKREKPEYELQRGFNN